MPRAGTNYVRVRFTYEGKAYETYGNTMEEALEKKIIKLHQLKNGEVGISSKMTVRRWGNEYLETYRKQTNGTKSYREMTARAEKYILSAIGSYRLSDVSDVHLQRILNACAGMSQSHIEKLMRLIKGIFRQARISRIIPYDPSEGLKPPNANKGKRRALTDYERECVMQVCDTHHAGLWVKMMLFCGLRKGETIALTWGDIDFVHGRVIVTKAKEAGTNLIKEPKTQAGVRQVPIPPNYLAQLMSVRGNPNDPIFPQRTRMAHHTDTSIRSLWDGFARAVMLEMGAKTFRGAIMIEPVCIGKKDYDKISTIINDVEYEPILASLIKFGEITPHALRHTYATDLQTAGVPLNIAKYLLGHTDVQTTANIYTSTDEQSILQAQRRIVLLEKSNGAGTIAGTNIE
ncbi:MAG: site-specific integrase [Oscillospiraceae bacterium]|jgi:integrase|nr:site-specific integrase [Oscillospiraceae bacterium]